MRGGKVRKLATMITIGALVSLVVKKLRGEPSPQFSNHPTVTGGPAAGAAGPRPTIATKPATATPLVPAPQDPTVTTPDTSGLVPAPSDPTVPEATTATGAAWVDPVDGTCPDGFPIKAKLKSGIYHQPGGMAYDRTKPDRCYPTVSAAEADGLRPPKR